MPTFQLDISQELLDKIVGIFPDDVIPQLALASLKEWLSWIDGSSRPMSISELETLRIIVMYEHLLEDRLPSAEHLGQLLGLPMGRARYIIQSLAYRNNHLLRKRQIQSIVRALDEGNWSADELSCAVHIDRSCQAIMDFTFSELNADNKIASIVKGVATMNGIRYVLGRGHHETIKATLITYLESNPSRRTT